MKSFCKFLIALSIFFTACEEEPIDDSNNPSSPENGTLKINIIGKHGSDDFVLYSDAVNTSGLDYRVEQIKFYVSNITTGNINTNDAFLVDLVNNHLSEGSTGESISISLTPGDYSGLSFLIGLDSLTNHGDPSLYEQEHPLSSFTGMHWDWSQGYKFMILDGKTDSDNDSIPDLSYSYHIGNDDYLQTISFDTPINIHENQTTEINVYMDVQNFFHGIDMINDAFTHSTSNFPLVIKLTDNISNSFSLNP